MASEGAAPAADVNDGAAQQAQAVTAPPALTGRLSGAPSVVLGVISAAKGALRLAPVVMDSGLSMAQSGTDTLTYYSRRGVELGTGAVRTGITTAGEAAAAHFEARAALAEDESTATSWQRWANNTKRSTSLIDRGINYGSDIVESHVLGAVHSLAQGGLSLAGHSLKSSMRTTKLLVGAADLVAKGALKSAGYNVSEISEANGHEQLVESILNVIDEVRKLSAQLDSVGTAELVRTLMTYARLVETVESEALFRRRRPVLSDYLEHISDERRRRALRAEQNDENEGAAAAASSSSSSSSGHSRRKSKQAKHSHHDPTTPCGHVVVGKKTETTLPASAARDKEKEASQSWGSWLFGWARGGSKGSAAADSAPEVAGDPHPAAGEQYEQGLYILAGTGMRRVSRAMLFAGCAYGPRFMSFLGVATKATTHEAFLVEQCAIAPDDLLLADFNSSLAHPGYFLAVDHATRQLMLVIRGSSALHDALTDLTCSFTRHVSGQFGSKGHAEGYAHEGMLKSAQWFAANMRQPILDAQRRYPEYSLVLSGHSLGGGVASLLALLWLHDEEMNPPHARLQAFCFGSPCVVSAELAHAGYGYVWNFVLGHDLVCRLSKGAVQDLTGVVLSLTRHSRQKYELLKLPSRQRRAAQAKLDAEAAAERAKALKAGRALPFVHPAAQDHKSLAALLDRYHALRERAKTDPRGMDAPLLAEENKAAEEIEKLREEARNSAGAAAAASAGGAGAAASSAPSGSNRAARTIRSETAVILDDLTTLLLSLRRGMKNEKLFPLGHIFHLLPNSASAASEENGAAAASSGQEDKKEKAQMHRIAEQAASSRGGRKENEGVEEDQADSQQSAAAASSASASAAASASSAASSVPKTIHVSVASRLDDLIGAAPLAIQEDAPNVAAAAAGLADAPMEDVLPSSNNEKGGITSWVPSFLRPRGAAGSAVAAAAAAPPPPPQPKATIPVARPVGAPLSSPVIAQPVNAANAAATVGTKRKADTSPRTSDESDSMALSPFAVAQPAVAASAHSSAAATAAPIAAIPRALVATQPSLAAPSVAPPIAAPMVAALQPSSAAASSAASAPVAAASAVAGPATASSAVDGAADNKPNLVQLPDTYSIVAGHWSDLTDLILSSNMLSHHLPAAYFVALATHETTQQQTHNEIRMRQLADEQRQQQAQPAPASASNAHASSNAYPKLG